MRGPVPDIPPLLQPVAHSLLQCSEEVRAVVAAVTPIDLWQRPAGAASAGFHLRHATGSLDRLFTYARDESLSSAQLAALGAEQEPDLADGAADRLIAAFEAQVSRALTQLRSTNEATLRDSRGVGRAKLPSTVVGLLFHGAEHTQRHIGQLVTTLKIVRGLADGVD
jgi:uncharacterized damage-inducible protein DinB